MSRTTRNSSPLRLAVIWIDWYPYHVARLEGLLSVPELEGRVIGIELVGGIGVHSGLKFREELPAHLPIETLLPDCSWQQAGRLRLARLLWRRLSELDPAAVLIPGYYTLPGIAAALWARVHRRTSILMTESTAHDHERVVWEEAAKSALLRGLFDFAVAGGKAHVRYLRQLGFPLSRIAHYYDVVDNAAIGEKAAALRKHRPEACELPPSPYFLYVGRLAPEKNVDGLLTAWIAYRDAGGDWPLVLVGDGPAAASLQQLAATSPYAEQVHFAGLRGSRELPLYYAFAGCFVLPSTREPWGLVVNEAMASGLPVLVSSLCGAAEDLVIEGRNGFTFDPASAQLTACLTHIGSLSTAALCAMGDESARLIAHYSPHNFGLEIESILSAAGA